MIRRATIGSITSAMAMLLGAACMMRAAERVSHSVVCDSGCGVSEGTCACQVCGRYYCSVVPDSKKVTKKVYRTKLVPYCRTKCPNPFKCRHDECSTCPDCEECVRYKRVLYKRVVTTTKSGYKCVPACEACRARSRGQSPANLEMPEPPPVPAAQSSDPALPPDRLELTPAE